MLSKLLKAAKSVLKNPVVQSVVVAVVTDAVNKKLANKPEKTS